jgi:hypothetical protein
MRMRVEVLLCGRHLLLLGSPVLLVLRLLLLGAACRVLLLPLLLQLPRVHIGRASVLPWLLLAVRDRLMAIGRTVRLLLRLAVVVEEICAPAPLSGDARRATKQG